MWTLFTLPLQLFLFVVSFSETTFTTADAKINPNLPFGDINVVILTDVHSWVGSHRRQEPQYDADLGDVLSFWEQLKDHCTTNDDAVMDLFLVNNGDFVHGTGLSRTTPDDPSYLIPLLEKMPYDALTCGNDELYSNNSVEYMTRPGGYASWWGDRYVTSNIVVHKTSDDDEVLPLGNRYKLLQGNNGGRLLVFGFLYNMDDASLLVEIQKVQDVVQQKWFVQALLEEHYDAILVLAHMDLVDPIVEVIRSAIRHHIGAGTSIVFVTGHTHYRGVKQLEDLTMTFEAGRDLDTVGFVSFPKKESVRSENSSSLFHHVFLDANRKLLFQETLGFARPDDGKTTNGNELSRFIDETRQKMGLEKEIGCAPQNYYLERPLDDRASLWRLYRDTVIPKMLSGPSSSDRTDEQAQDSRPIVMLLSNGCFRNDILTNATLIVDDIVSVAPFNDTLMYLGIFDANLIIQANQSLNDECKDQNNTLWRPMLPNFILIGDLDNSTSTSYHLYTHDFDASTVQKVFHKLAPDQTIEIKPTEFRSTLIWMAFVKEYWSCDGIIGQLPDWFPTPQHIVKNSSSKDNRKRAAGVVMGVVFIGFVMASAYVCWLLFRHFCMYQTVSDDEIAAFKDDNENHIHEGSETQAEQRFSKAFNDEEDHEVI